VSTAAELDRVVDAFIEGRTDFARFRQVIEQQLARHPEHVGPALKRVGSLKKSGRISPALHALISRELDRSSKGDITAPFDEPEAAPAEPQAASETTGTIQPSEAAEANEATESIESIGSIEGVASKIPPVLTKTTTGPKARTEPSVSEASSRASAVPAAALPAAGTVLAGRYELEAMLGRGGMSVVYRARDLRRRGNDAGAARVGIKLVNPEYAGRDYRRALEQEASLLAELSHRGIVRMLGFDQDGEHAFMVMELLNGERLRSRLVRSHPEALPRGEAMRIIRELAEALAYLHQRKLVHRDVKPANVFLTMAGEVRLIDFGLAAPVGGSGDPEDVAPKAWTPLYASPEMLGGAAASPRDDVYSLGCVAYEILAGRHPWGSLPGDQAAHRKLRARRPAGLARPRWKVLRSALAFRAAARPANAAEFINGFFPPARPRRVMPWVAAAFLVGIASGLALRPFATDPWVQRFAPLFPAVITPAPVMPPAEVLAPERSPTEGAAAAPATVDDPAAVDAPGLDVPAAEEEPGPVAAEAESAAAPGATEAPAQQPAEDDPAGEGPVSGPEQAAIAGSPPAPDAMAFPSSRIRVSEGGGAVRLELRRPAGYSGMLSVMWRTVDGRARDGVDFVGNPSWQQAMTTLDAPSLILFIPIVDDSVPGPDRNFLVELRQLPGGPPVGSPDQVEVTILDDD